MSRTPAAAAAPKIAQRPIASVALIVWACCQARRRRAQKSQIFLAVAVQVLIGHVLNLSGEAVFLWSEIATEFRHGRTAGKAQAARQSAGAAGAAGA
jgi:hypothetical protein